MELRKRQQGPRPQRPISWMDVVTVSVLPILLVVPIVVPEHKWLWLCLGLETLVRALAPRKDDRRVLKNLAAFGQNAPDGAIRVWALRTEHLLQVMRELTLGWRPEIELTGQEHLEEARKAGHGAVLWIARMSFASLAEKMAFANAGYEVIHISRPQHGFSKTSFGMRFLNPIRVRAEYRHAAGRVLIDADNPSESVVEARKHLRANKFVSVTAGISQGQLLVSTKLSGGTLELPSGAPRIANLAKAPLLPVFVVRDDRGVVRVIVDRPIAIPRDGGKEELVKTAAQEFAERHLPFLKAYPHQWRDWKNLVLRGT